MITGKAIRIIAMGKHLPKLVSSEELEQQLSIPIGYSMKYSGVNQRHHVQEESNGSMGAKAADNALEKAGMSLKQIDMIISASGTFDYPIPNQASIIKNMMKEGSLYDVPAIDIDSTCLSFVAAFDIAATMLNGGSMKNILIVSSEIASKGLNHDNWETTTLFGDAAVAAILSYDESSPSLFIKGRQKTYSEGTDLAMVKGGGNKYYPKDYPYDKELYAFQMKGKNLLRLAKKKIPPFMDSFFKDLPLNIEDADAIIPHQASKIGLHVFSSLFKFKGNQMKRTLHKYGNCIAASIPLTLMDSIDSGDIKRGDICLLCGTSSGFSIGSVLIKY